MLMDSIFSTVSRTPSRSQVRKGPAWWANPTPSRGPRPPGCRRSSVRGARRTPCTATGCPYVAGVPVLVGLLDQEPQPGGEVSCCCASLATGISGSPRVVLEGLQVQYVEDGLAFTFVSLVETGAGLVAEQVLLLHLLELLRRLEILARLVLGDGLVEVLGHADGDVQPDLVVEPEGRRLRVADEGACYILLRSRSRYRRRSERIASRKGSYPVTYKVRGVLGDDSALA